MGPPPGLNTRITQGACHQFGFPSPRAAGWSGPGRSRGGAAVPDAWGPSISFVNWLVGQEEAIQIQCGYIFIEDLTRVHFLSCPEQRIAESVDEPHPQPFPVHDQSTITIVSYLLDEMLKPVVRLFTI